MQAAFHLEADHATELLHLFFGDLVAAVGRQSGIVDAQDLGMRLEVPGQTLSGVRLTVDAQM